MLDGVYVKSEWIFRIVYESSMVIALLETDIQKLHLTKYQMPSIEIDHSGHFFGDKLTYRRTSIFHEYSK